jgi:ADP-heptose:LPS heptosyltransferase
LGESFDRDHGAFMDTAAVFKNVDLVITSDTSVAHLAGALGVPTWVALPIGPDWRWHVDRDDSPWYPTMRLFRQSTLGQWRDVFERITAALGPLVAAKRDSQSTSEHVST